MSAFPASPTNGQQVTVNGVVYTYSTALTAWTVTSSGGSLSSASALAVTGNVTGGNLITGGAISATGQITSLVTNGTAPLVTSSTTLVSNLNADLWDGNHFGSYLNQGVLTSSAPTFAGVNISAGTASQAPIDLTAGTNLTTPLAGAVEFDGVCMYGTIDTTNGRGSITPNQYYRLTADLAATATTISPFFGTNSAIPLVANGIYEIEFYCSFLKTTAGTLVWTFTNSTTVTNLVVWSEMSAITGSGTTGTWAAPLAGILRGQTAAAVALPATGSLTTAVYHFARFRVILENGASTSIRLNVTNSAGTVTPGRGSYWKARRLSATNNSTYAA